MEWFIDPFANNEFMQRALLAGLVVAVLCSVIGTFVVLRGLAFIGDALGHGVLPGVALAILWSYPAVIGATAGAAVIVGGVHLITRRSRLSTDTATGMLFIGMLALGVVIVSRSQKFAGDLVRVLFGEILGVGWTDLRLQLLASAVVLGLTIAWMRPFILLSFSEEQAEVSGFSARWYHLAMLLLVSVTVIVSYKTVGTLLVFGMLVAPAATGALIARRVTHMMAVASVSGCISVYAGLLISYHYDLAAGASIVLCAVGLFLAALVVQNVREPRLLKRVAK